MMSPPLVDLTSSPIKIEPINFYGCERQEELRNNIAPTTNGSHVSEGICKKKKKTPSVIDLTMSPERVETHLDYLQAKDHWGHSFSPLVLEQPEPTKEPKTPVKQLCKICGKTLSSTSSYYVHMKLHSDNKPFKCNICEASFCRKPYLEVHMRTHTGERPFECRVCKKRFTQKSSLNTHKRSHTGEKPYVCDLCGKRFSVKSYVEAHRWSHLGDKPLRCDVCQVTFTTKGQFMEHIRQHDSKKNFDCNICGRGFIKESYLIRHHIRVHKKNVNKADPGASPPIDVGDSEHVQNNDGELPFLPPVYDSDTDYDEVVPASYVESQLTEK